MKLPRPALASAAAITIAAGSITIVNAADRNEPAAHAANNAAANSPVVGEAAPLNNPSAVGDADSPVVIDAADTPDAVDPVDPVDPVNSVDPAEFSDLDGTFDAVPSDEAYDSLPPASPAEIRAAVSALSQPRQVDPELEVLAQNVPDTQSQAAQANRAAMRKMNSPVDAPKKIFGGGDEPQSWYGAEGVEGWYVYSESMRRDIPVALIRATGPDGKPVSKAPTLYLLNGAGGAEQDADWISIGKAHQFYKGKGVNVVIPMEGAFSYYVDWLTDGETLKQKSRYFKGEQKWSTFLGKELPPAVEHELGANDKRGVLGFSMSGTSSLLLAEHFPDKYDAVGSFSGCAATSTPLPWAFVALTVNRAATQGDVTPAHIWGPMGSPYNRYNDALVNAEKLRDKAIYISNGSGTASQSDMISYRLGQGQSFPQASSGSWTTTVEGGVIEAATNSCTHDLRAKLNHLDIDAHYEFRKTGTHAWSVWLDDLNRSWNTTFGPALVGEQFARAEEPALDRPVWNAGGSSN